jgi:hypothetical protein
MPASPSSFLARPLPLVRRLYYPPFSSRRRTLVWQDRPTGQGIWTEEGLFGGALRGHSLGMRRLSLLLGCCCVALGLWLETIGVHGGLLDWVVSRLDDMRRELDQLSG